MENKVNRFKLFIFDNQWHSSIISLLVGLLMISIYFWVFVGFILILKNLYHFWLLDSWSHGAETMIKDVVIILALLELIRVFQSYLLIGRVKVTLILDVVLVIMIGELVSLWYRDYNINQVFLGVFMVSALIALRMITIKFSPNNEHGF